DAQPTRRRSYREGNEDEKLIDVSAPAANNRCWLLDTARAANMRRSPLVGLSCLLWVGLFGCSDRKQPRGDIVVEGQPFHDVLLGIAQSYESYHRVDPQGRWAPYRCNSPSPYVSTSEDLA